MNGHTPPTHLVATVSKRRVWPARALWLTLPLFATGCFDGETRILGDAPRTDAAVDGGEAGAGGGGGGGTWPTQACHLDIEAQSLSGFEGDPQRWSAADGRITAASDTDAGRDRTLLLRGTQETCTDFTASVEFIYTAGAFPLLIGRATPDGQWIGIGYDGTYGNFTATNGLGTELRDRIGELDPVDLTPGELYRLEMRVIDGAVIGLLSDIAAETPIAIVQGPAGATGPGRIGLYEAAGVATDFGVLKADPTDRGPDGAPAFESARLIDPRTLILTLSPAQTVPLTAPSPDGFQVHVDGAARALESVRVRPGTASELELHLKSYVVGANTLTLSYDPSGGAVQDASQRKLGRIDLAPVENLLHADKKFEPFVDTFEGERLGAGWHPVQREAFTLNGGAVRISPTDPYATGAMLLRPIAERHVDSELVMDFRFDRQPDRGLGRIEAVAALRARSFLGAQYQAALTLTRQTDYLVIRHMTGGQPTELAVATVPAGEALPGRALRLTFAATGPLLSATLSDDSGRVIVRTAAADTRILNGGPAGVTGQWDGTIRVDRVEVREATPPPPFIESARVRAETPGQVDLRVLSATPLRYVSASGFTVWAGDRREVTALRPTDDGLALVLSAPAIQGGQAVRLRYDPAVGDVTDSARPPQPLAAADQLVVVNEAAPGTDLAVASAVLLTPHTLDLVTTDNGALPLRTEGAVPEALTVEVDGQPVRIVRAYALGNPHGNVLRVTLADDVEVGQSVTLAYAAGGAGRVLDTEDGELGGFLGAPVGWAVPAWPAITPETDAFDRPEQVMGLGNGWHPATEGLWSIRDEVAVFQSAGVDSLDARAARPGQIGPRYDVSTRIWTSAFDPVVSQPVAVVFGSLTRTDPRQPQSVQAAFNFATQIISLQQPDGSVSYGPRVPAGAEVGAGDVIRLRLRVHGRAARTEVMTAAGDVLAATEAFLRAEPALGELGIGGSAGARVLYFDDFQVANPEETAPNMLVTDVRVTPDNPNAVLMLAQTALGASGALLTGGGPEGFAITVGGGRRDVVSAQAIGSGLVVTFAGAPAAQRQLVTLAYDDRRGDVHDTSLPTSRPLDGFAPRTATNGADIGADLFMESAETVGPCVLDVVVNAQAAQPVRAEPGASAAFSLTADGRDVPVRDLVVLPGRQTRVRLVLGAALDPTQALEVAYSAGVDDARLLDRGGRELQPGYTVGVANRIEPSANFEPFEDTFAGVGAGIVNGWLASPEHDWSRSVGDTVLSSDDEGVEGSLLRPSEEAQLHVEVETGFRPNPPAFGTLVVGIAGRVSGQSGYRFLISPENAQRATLILVKHGLDGVRVAGVTSFPALVAGEDYRLTARFHGPVLQAILRHDAPGAAPLARLQIIDDTPLAAGQNGVLGRTVGQVRFHDVTVRPAIGYPARVVAVSGRSYTYAPQVIRVILMAPTPLALADGRGFSVTVNGAARPVAGVNRLDDAVELSVGGPPLAPGQDIRVAFDPTAGYVYDDSPVPQPLGAFSNLPVEVVSAPLRSATTQVGENILRLEFAAGEGLGPLQVEGDGGLAVNVRAPSLGASTVAFGVDEVWLDPAGAGRRLFVATTDDFPPDAQVQVLTIQRAGARIVDAAGTPLADFGVEAVGAAALAEAGADYPDRYTWSWEAEAPWAYYGRLAAWQPMAGELIGQGSGEPETDTTALAPVATSGREMKVAVDFEIDVEAAPFGRPAFPRVVLRAYNDGTWLGCFVRNDFGRIPARDPDGGISGAIDPMSPALVCGRRVDFGARRTFEGCRMQFYDEVEGQSVVRYDWAAAAQSPHRLTVAVAGHHLRATLDRLDGGQPTRVAVVDVPDIGDDLNAGLPGLGSGDGGSVRFSNFTVDRAGLADFDALGAEFAPSGACP